MLDMLAQDTSDTKWNDYEGRFGTHDAARYYKLLFVQGEGDHRQIATIREDGRQEMVLSTGIAGANINPCWERSAQLFGFVVRHGATSAVYMADYPETHDLNDGEGTIQWGIDQGDLRSSLHRLGITNGVAQIAWTPNGEYLASSSGGSLRLLPLPKSGLSAVTLATQPSAPYGFSWMPDDRSAVLTVSGSGGTQFQVARLSTPLLDIENVKDFDDVKPADRTYLSRNAFVACGAAEPQMFDVYEETDYQDEPIFITTDSLLHLHHLVFDYLLRGVESEHLAPDVIALVNHYLSASLYQAKTATTPAVIADADENAAFFAVAAQLAMGRVHTGETSAAGGASDSDDPLAADRIALRAKQDAKDRAVLAVWNAPLRQTMAALPPAVTHLVNEEIALISAHAGAQASPIFGDPQTDSKLDYTDFIPRGHYTRSELLRRYFLMTRWLGAGAFLHTPDLTRRALLIVAATDPVTLARWHKVEDTVHAFAGEADDQDLDSYLSVAKDAYGAVPTTVSGVLDPAKFADFQTRSSQLPKPRIAPSAGASFRFLPSPYTPDAEIMQDLVYDGIPPDVGTETQPRYFALGLDVMAVLGSDRAHTLLQTTDFQGSFFDFDLDETQYANYEPEFDALHSRFANWTEADWSRSLYTRTLYAVLPLLDPQPNAAPAGDLFAQTPAWTDKSLNSALGTWAELKHDVLPKQPVAIEAGGEGGISEAVVPVQPVGFVEPNPEVYRRLALLVDAERATLTSEGYLDAANANRLNTLSNLLTMVQSLERKQATGVPLDAHEVQQLRFYGAYQEHLTLMTAPGGEQGSTEGNDMAIVADVSSAKSTKLNELLALEEGVGRALPIYVAVPINGHRQLACGAIFTYYEFTHPASDRLTDEAWRALLDTSNAPAMPDWTKSFVSHLDKADSDAASDQ